MATLVKDEISLGDFLKEITTTLTDIYQDKPKQLIAHSEEVTQLLQKFDVYKQDTTVLDKIAKRITAMLDKSLDHCTTQQAMIVTRLTTRFIRFYTQTIIHDM